MAECSGGSPPWSLIEPSDLAKIVKQGTDKVLLIDSRSFLEFNTCNIQQSVNVCCSKLVKRRLQQDKVHIRELLTQTCHIDADQNYEVIVYDQCTEHPDLLTEDSFLKILLRKLAATFSSVTLLKGGFLGFQAMHPLLCESKSNNSKCAPLTSLSQPCMPITNVGPTRILPFLYLGSQQDAMCNETIQVNGINYILNVSSSCPKPSYIPDGHFHRIPVNDNYCAKLLPFFCEAFQFLDKVHEANGCVLVHCLAGISRSPTLAIAYVMKHLRMSSDDAYRYVKDKRPTISPNFNFLGQLLEYERKLKKEREDCKENIKSSRNGACSSTPIVMDLQLCSPSTPSTTCKPLSDSSGETLQTKQVLSSTDSWQDNSGDFVHVFDRTRESDSESKNPFCDKTSSLSSIETTCLNDSEAAKSVENEPLDCEDADAISFGNKRTRPILSYQSPSLDPSSPGLCPLTHHKADHKPLCGTSPCRDTVDNSITSFGNSSTTTRQFPNRGAVPVINTLSAQSPTTALSRLTFAQTIYENKEIEAKKAEKEEGTLNEFPTTSLDKISFNPCFAKDDFFRFKSTGVKRPLSSSSSSTESKSLEPPSPVSTTSNSSNSAASSTVTSPTANTTKVILRSRENHTKRTLVRPNSIAFSTYPTFDLGSDCRDSPSSGSTSQDDSSEAFLIQYRKKSRSSHSEYFKYGKYPEHEVYKQISAAMENAMLKTQVFDHCRKARSMDDILSEDSNESDSFPIFDKCARRLSGRGERFGSPGLFEHLSRRCRGSSDPYQSNSSISSSGSHSSLHGSLEIIQVS